MPVILFYPSLRHFAEYLLIPGAMISDAIHSASDVFSSIIVIIGVKMSAKGSDAEHPYGHERFECVAAIILSVILLITGLFVGSEAVQNVIRGNYRELTVPGLLALAGAIISINNKRSYVSVHNFFCKAGMTPAH